MKCRKCQLKEVYSNGLCKSCYNKFYYSKNAHGVELKQFITETEHKTYYKSKPKNYDEFAKVYNENMSKTKLAKELGVSRETLYKYIKRYKGE